MADPARVTLGGTWVTRLAGLLPAILLVFAAAAFILPNDPAYSLIFYVAAVPATLAWYRVHGAVRDLTTQAWLALALIVWSGLTLLWGHDDGHRTGRFAGDTAATLLFVLALLAVLPQTAWRARLGTVLVWAGAGNAVFSIALGFLGHPLGPRLTGWGVTTNSILGACVMIGCYATALARALLQPGRTAPNLAAAALMAVFILLTESRGPLLSAAVVTVLLCAASPWRKTALRALCAAAVLWLLLPAAMRRHHATLLIGRGSSHHFEIWQRTLALIGERPVFGHGLASNTGLPGLTFPHDLYLSLLFYSGVVGFALFVALAVACIWRLVRRRQATERLWIACLWLNALLCGMTDLGQITKGPGPMWFIVWLPVCLMAYREKRSAGPEQAGALLA